MDDLIGRLNAALDETERIALAANPSPWRWRIPNARHLDQNTIFGDGSPPGRDKLRQVCSVEMAWEREANAAHIVHNDPDSILRQVAAHRELIAVYEQACAFYNVHKDAPAGEVHGLYTAIKLVAKGYGIAESDEH